MTTHDHSTPEKMATRQKLILSGLYLSKYDSAGLKNLGFENFAEAFNVIGYGLGSRPASIKNYRDEFDPLFPNERKGWHKRPIRDYCRAIFEEYKGLDLESFTGLVKSFFGYDGNVESEIVPTEKEDEGASSFAQRLITGLAAEQYFESIHAELPEFKGYLMENTTRFGCGYDFRLRTEPKHKDFLVVEVKGLKEQTGSLSMTPKEYDVASALRERFYLFVVRNFRESPSHSIFRDPLSSELHFRKTERVTIQVSWLTTV
ncbi:MAG: protein NO VEIN domain-containing protein [Acidobacteriaceae bacterium]